MFVVSSMMGSFHPGIIAAGLFGGSLFGGGMIATSFATRRFKKNVRCGPIVLAVEACVMMIAVLGPALCLGETHTFYSPLGWPWGVSFSGGVFLVLSALSGRR